MYQSTEAAVSPSWSPNQTPRLSRVALTAPNGAVDGRSPDLRINVSPSLPKPFSSVAFAGVTHRSQLRGQLRIWRLSAAPHRIPFSSQRRVRRVETISTLLKGVEQRVKWHCRSVYTARKWSLFAMAGAEITNSDGPKGCGDAFLSAT